MISELQLTAARTYDNSFTARNILVTNNSSYAIYVKIGAQEIPTVNGAAMIVLPFMQMSLPIAGARFFGFGFSAGGAIPSNGGIAVIFHDLPQSLFTQTINPVTQPGAGQSWGYVYVEPVMNAGASVTLVTTPANKTLWIALIKCIADPTSAATPYYFYHTTSPDIMTLVVSAVVGEVPFSDELNCQPQGCPLPLGKSLKVQNGAVGARQPGFFVLYSFA